MDYNPIAVNYDYYSQEAITDWVLGYKNLKKIFTPLQDKTVLDFGCGTGRSSRFFRDNGANVIAIENSERMIEQARLYNSRNIQYFFSKNEDMSFIKENTIDYASISFVLFSLQKKTQVQKVFKEIHRIIKPGGKFTILDVNIAKSNGRDFISFSLEAINNPKTGDRTTGTLKSDIPLTLTGTFWNNEDCIIMLKEAGFTIKELLEPIAQDDKYEWIDEKNYPTFVIFVAEK